MKKTKLATGQAPAQGAQQSAPPQSGEVDWSQYADQPTGFENTTQEDLGIPFLTIVQKGSPEVDRGHKDYAAKHIEGAETGDVVNTLSRLIVYKHGRDPIVVVPCGYDKQFVEWKPRESGGGMVRAHRDSRIIDEVVRRNEKGQDMLKNGNVLVTTAYFFCLHYVPGEQAQQIVIGMSSTQLKHARFWLNMMANLRVGPQRITPPMFSHFYNLSTVPESNNKGSWMGWKIEIKGMVNEPKLIEAGSSVCKRVAMQSQKLLSAPRSPEEDKVPM